MAHVDPTFLIFFNAGISLIMGFYMAFLHRNATGVRGTVFWAAGSIIVGIGLLLRFIPPETGFWAVAGPPLFVTTGLYSYLSGIWHFKEKKIQKWLVFGIPTFDILQSIFFFWILPSHRLRLAIHTLILIVYCLIALYEMLYLLPKHKHLKKIFKLNAISYIIYLGVLLISLTSILGNPGFRPYQVTEAMIMVFIISGFIMIALTFGFLSAVNLQLNMELLGQLKSKNKFFSIIAHDLRGPVGTIMSFLNLLNTEPGITNEQRQNFLGKIELLSQSTFHLLQNLLDWATSSKNLANAENEIIELNQMVLSNISFFRNLTDLKSLQLEFNPGRQTLVQGNSKMLETVVRNLVSNAIKFTPKGGKITITTSNNEQKVKLMVIDTGCGIAPEKLNSIFSFESNSTSRGTDGETGSGLGLILCNEFIKRNNGQMHINSKLNHGTSVELEFPAAYKNGVESLKFTSHMN